MTNHTPGPWEESQLRAFTIQGKNGQYVCQLYHGMRDKTEALANARLIATAPELLLAVKGYAQYLKLDGRESAELDDLIAKAEGK